MARTSIQVNNLSYTVAGQTLLDSISTELHAGKIHVILGQNGAGKSTLLQCLTKELAPTQGHISWQGEPLHKLPLAALAQQRAVLSQSLELVFAFSVEQVVRLGAEVQHHMQAAAVVEAVLQVCDLQNLRSRNYLTLSGGEQKRTQIARVLAQIWPQNPQSAQAFQGKWLFLDEWSASLDIKHQLRLAKQMRLWAQQGLGIVMVLHDLNQIAQLADNCLVLKNGRLQFAGNTQDALSENILQAALDVRLRVEWDVQSQRPMILPCLGDS